MRITVFLIALFGYLFISGQSVKFNNVGVRDGLSNSWVKSIHKDSRGFMWFGTFTGLNRFDGYNFKVFKHDPNDPRSLADNHVASIYEDSKGRIWVSNANSGYVNLYDPDSEDFTVYKLPGRDLLDANLGHVATDGPIYEDGLGNLWVGNEFGATLFDSVDNEFYQYELIPNVPDEQQVPAVYSIEEDDNGILWFGTIDGVITHDFQKKTTRRYLPSDDSNSLSNPLVKDIHKDESGKIWLATWGGGLHLYRAEKDDFIQFQYDPFDPTSLGSNDILSLDGNGMGKLYIGTENGGLDIMDIHSHTFEHHTTQIDYEFSLSSNSIYAVFHDMESQILWLGTFNGGVDYMTRWSKPFIHDKAQLTKLNNNKVTTLLKNEEGDLWIGTDGGGVNIRSRQDGSFSYLLHDPNNPKSLMSNAVLAILEDSDKRIWIGSYDGGVDLLNPVSGDFTHFRPLPGDTTSLSGFHVSSLCEDRYGNIWVGTFDAGVSVLNRMSGKFVRYQNDTTNAASLSNNFVQGIFSDSKGDIYVSTMITLDVFDPESRSFSRFDPVRLTGVRRTVVMEDKAGNLWIGSANGLFCYDSYKNFRAQYTIQDGLPDNNITGILEDDNGNLWLSTHNGLVKFSDPLGDSPDFRTYTIEEGLQGAEFKYGAYYQDDQGLMYFGGQNGFNHFHPGDVIEDPNVPPVVITGLKVFNKNVDFGKDGLIPRPISRLKEIALSYKESVVTLEYAALGYTLPAGNSYAFMLEGFEEEWNHVGTSRSATYTNLDAGDYVFRVKAANSDGVWNEAGESLKITVLPPFYATWWFRTILLLSIFIFIGLYSRMRILRYKRDQKVLESRVYKRTRELHLKNQELAKMSAEKQRVQEKMWESEKMASLGILTAGIAHEINNPLNFIKGSHFALKEHFKEKADPEIKSSLDTLEIGIDRAAEIVTSLNQFSRNNKNDNDRCDIHSIIENCLTILKKQYEGRIEIAKNYQSADLIVTGNSGKLHQVFLNVLTNSIHAIEESGEIAISTHTTPDHSQIEVKDTGTGISREHLSKISVPFFTTKEPGKGTGLGLSITYSIIKDHGGTIDFNSEKGKGTTVVIRLPHIPGK